MVLNFRLGLLCGEKNRALEKSSFRLALLWCKSSGSLLIVSN
jgi:hypothetical protein